MKSIRIKGAEDFICPESFFFLYSQSINVKVKMNKPKNTWNYTHLEMNVTFEVKKR